MRRYHNQRGGKHFVLTLVAFHLLVSNSLVKIRRTCATVVYDDLNSIGVLLQLALPNHRSFNKIAVLTSNHYFQLCTLAIMHCSDWFVRVLYRKGQNQHLRHVRYLQ